MQKIVQRLECLNGKDGKFIKIDRFLKFMIQLLKLKKKSLIMNIKSNNINMVMLIGTMVQTVHTVILNTWMNHIIMINTDNYYKHLLLMM